MKSPPPTRLLWCPCGPLILAAITLFGPLEVRAWQDVTRENLDEVVARVMGVDDPPPVRVELGLGCLAVLAEAPDPELELQIRLALGVALSGLERFGEAWDHLERTVRLATAAGDDKTLAHALWLQAVSAFNLGRLDEGAQCARAGMVAGEAAQWDAALWRIANVLGLIEERRGNSTAALEAFRRGQEAAERVAEQSGNTEGVSVLLGNIGITYMNLGELEQSLEIFQRTHELQLASPTQTGLHSTVANIGDVLIHLGRPEEARAYHRQALELRRELGSEVELALSYHSLGIIHQRLEEYDLALAELERSLEIRRRLELIPDVATTLAAMAQVYSALDRDDEALVSARSGLELADQLAMKGRRLAILEGLGVVYEELGDNSKAIDVYHEVTELERSQRSLETRLQLAEFRAEFETREKEQQIELLSRERELQELALTKQRFERNVLLVAALFVALAALVGWFAWASLRRAMKRISNLEQQQVRAENLECLGVLAGGIAHDFNNILAVVIGNLSVLRMEAAADDSARQLLNDADQALDQGKLLANQLLSLAKGGAHAPTLQAMAPLIRESTSFALSGSHSKAELDIAPQLWAAEVDSGQVRQLIANLVMNASQAMPNGGIVQVRAENVKVDADQRRGLDGGPCVRITVTDHGTGIAPAIQSKVFDPYFTTKERGSGLGLALAYAIVERHRGAIEYRSTPGGGTTFEVLIPARSEPQHDPPIPDETIRRGAGRILVMDDDASVLKFYDTALTRLGYECELVEDGAAAVASMERAQRDSKPFRVAILDLTISGGTGGRETIKQLQRRDPGIRAIVASGYSADSVLENYRAAGFVGVLPKPFTVTALSQAVAAAAAQPDAARQQ